MATGKTPAKKTTAKKTTARKSTARKSTARKSTARKSTAKRTTARQSTTRRRTTTRRPQPALSTTIGSALGALIVTTLLDLSWPIRIALIVGVLVLGLGFIVWKNRSAIAAETAGASAGHPSAEVAEVAPQGPVHLGDQAEPQTVEPPTDQP